MARRPNVFAAEFPTPMMLLRESAIEHNIRIMARYCSDHGVDLAPHGKTTMAPQLIARQLAAGAWGISAATPAQVQVYRAFGIPRIILANQLVDRSAVRWLGDELAADSRFDFYCQVDSVAGVRLLDEALADCPAGVRLAVLVELGIPGGRAGCRSPQEFREVARVAGESSRLSVAGTAGYEGSVAHDVDPRSLDMIATYLRSLREVTQSLIDQSLVDPGRREVVVATGSSIYFDLVVEELTGGWRSERPVRTVLRSGAYIAHDHGLYASVSPFARYPGAGAFRAALEAWGRVLSRPERTLAVLDVGRRDVPADQGLPIALAVRHRDGSMSPAAGLSVVALHDQHSFLELPASARLVPGEWVGLGISHPCTAFDKWKVLFMVDNDDNVVDCVRTFF